MSVVVFLDTEATGTHAHRRAWEIALIRRDTNGAEHEITLFVASCDLDLDHADPESLAISGFHVRHPAFGANLQNGQHHVSEAQTASIVYEWTANTSVYGISPGFDRGCLEPMFARHGLRPAWFYEPQDIASLASEHLLTHGQMPARDVEQISWQCGVPVPGSDRHTALGDARWARNWFDQLCAARDVINQ